MVINLMAIYLTDLLVSGFDVTGEFWSKALTYFWIAVGAAVGQNLVEQFFSKKHGRNHD
jgi:hypothetical protein